MSADEERPVWISRERAEDAGLETVWDESPTIGPVPSAEARAAAGELEPIMGREPALRGEAVTSEEDKRLLSLDEDAVEVRYALMEAGHELYRATLMAHHAPLAQHRFERMSNPEVGDYVLETSSRRSYRVGDGYRGFGILLSEVAKNFGPTRVQYGPADEDVVTWENASFVALPIRDARWWRP